MLAALSLRTFFRKIAVNSFKEEEVGNTPVRWASVELDINKPTSYLPQEFPSGGIKAKVFCSNYSYFLLLLAKTAMKSSPESIEATENVLNMSYGALFELIKYFPDLCNDRDGQKTLDLFFNSELPMRSFALLNTFKVLCNSLFTEGHSYGIFKNSTITIAALTYINPEATAQFSDRPNFHDDMYNVLDKLLQINTRPSLYQALQVLKPIVNPLFDTRPKERVKFFARISKALEKKPFVDDKGISCFETFSDIIFPKGKVIGTGYDDSLEHNRNLLLQMITSTSNTATDFSIENNAEMMTPILKCLPMIFMRVHHHDLFLSPFSLNATMEGWTSLHLSYIELTGQLEMTAKHMKFLALTFQKGICEHQIEYQQTVTLALKVIILSIKELKPEGYQDFLQDLQEFFSKDIITIDKYDDEKITEIFD